MMNLSHKEKLEIAADLARREFDGMLFGCSDGGDMGFVSDVGVIYTGQAWPADDDDLPEAVRNNLTKLKWHDQARGWRAERKQDAYRQRLETCLTTAHITPRRFWIDDVEYEAISDLAVTVVGCRAVAAYLPKTVDSSGRTFTVLNISHRAFASCSQLTAVTIPDTVGLIAEEAFLGCAELETLAIPDSVLSVGAEAFSGCAKLVSVILPDNGIKLGNHAFRDCTSLEAISLPRSVGRIGASVFDGCTSLRSITVLGLSKKTGQWKSRLDPKSINSDMCPGWVNLVFEYLGEGEHVPITASFLKSSPPPELLSRMVMHSDARSCENKLALMRALAGTDRVDALEAMESWEVFTKRNLEEALKVALDSGSEAAATYLAGRMNGG